MTNQPHDPAPLHAPTKMTTYFVIFAALIACTLLTVAASRVEMGWANTPVAMGIAILKATLVILFFMHVIHSTRLTWVVIGGALLWIGVLFALTFADYLTRAWQIY